MHRINELHKEIHCKSSFFLLDLSKYTFVCYRKEYFRITFGSDLMCKLIRYEKLEVWVFGGKMSNH